jgi:hypothetical protein
MPFDISKLPESWVKQLILGIIPGGVLLIGLALTHFDQAEKFLNYNQLSGSVKLALSLFVAEAAGFVLLSFGALVVILVYFLGYATACIMRRRTFDTSSDSENMVWRRIATLFLSATLARLEEPGLPSQELERKLKAVAQGVSAQDHDFLVKKLAEVAATELYRANIDTEWRYLNSVLQCYCYKTPTEDVWYTLVTLYGLALSCGVWADYSISTAWPLWLCVLCALLPSLLSLYLGFCHAILEPYEGRLGALILKEWKSSAKPAQP